MENMEPIFNEILSTWRNTIRFPNWTPKKNTLGKDHSGYNAKKAIEAVPNNPFDDKKEVTDADNFDLH